MKTRILLAMVCLGMLGAAARGASPLAKRVPGGALAYAGWAGSRDATFQKATIAGFLKEPVFDRILDTVKALISNDMYSKEEKKAFAAAWPMVEIAGRSPMAAMWTGMEKVNGEPSPRIALLVDLGKETKAFNGHIEAVIKLAPPEARKLIKKVTVGGVTYRTVKTGDGPDVSFGYMGDVFFLAVGSGVATELIALKPADSLQADKTFVARMKEVGSKDEQLSFYLDVTSVRKAVAAIAPRSTVGTTTQPADRSYRDLSADEMLRALGLAKVRAIAGATTVVKSELVTRTKLFSPGPHRGAMTAFTGKPLVAADLAHVPADADVVMAYNISATRAWKELRRIVRRINPRDEKEMQEGFGMMGRMLGVSFEDDILAHIGDTWVFSSAVSQGGSPTGSLLTAELKDAKAFAKTLAKMHMAARLKKMLNDGAAGNDDDDDDDEWGRPATQSLHMLKAGDTEIHYLVSRGGFIPMPFLPAWAVHKDKLYLALYPQVIKAAIDNEGKNPLIGSPRYAALKARINANSVGLAYVNTPQLIGRHYAMSLVLTYVLANETHGRNDRPITPDFLPAMSVISTYVPECVQTVGADDTGVLFERHGSLPLTGLVDAFFTAGPMLIPTVAIPLED